MCGRFVLKSRPEDIRQQLVTLNGNLNIQSVPRDDQIRNTYNFAPTNIGIALRSSPTDSSTHINGGISNAKAVPEADDKDSSLNGKDGVATLCQLDAMEWGLIPSWSKGSVENPFRHRAINCRDDSLATNSSMWTSMKRSKRCVVVADGFYEWLKANDGTRVPHYIKRKDGQLMYFAGLWDCGRLNGVESGTPTFAIITTSSNKQLEFLHERMPVMLHPSLPEITTWLNVSTPGWTHELQSICRPYQDNTALDIYRVGKGVGNIANDSSSLIIPLPSPIKNHDITSFFKRGPEPTESRSEGRQNGSHVTPNCLSSVKREHPDSDSLFLTSAQSGKRPRSDTSIGSRNPKSGANLNTTKLTKHDGEPSTQGTIKPTPSAPAKNMKITSFFREL